MQDIVKELMNTAIDTHVHFAPDSITEYVPTHNAYDICKNAREYGMRGLVLKNTTFPSAGIAYLMENLVPGIKVFGSIVLNKSVGGMNPIAVEKAVVHGLGRPGEYCKVVWMPTTSSATDVRYYKKRKIEEVLILQEDRLLPEVKDILKLVAENNLVLATGHLNVEEAAILIDAAKDIGVKKIVLTHPHNVIPYIGIPRQKEFAQKGVFIEFCSVMYTEYYYKKYNFVINPARIAMDIKEVGVGNSIIATDYGLDYGANPTPAEGMRIFIGELLKCGISPEEIRIMQQNSCELLDMEIM